MHNNNKNNDNMRSSILALLALTSSVSGFAFTQQKPAALQRTHRSSSSSSSSSSSTSLSMEIDQNVLIGGAIGVGSFAAGIGLVVFTEQQGERAKERGSGLSDNMSTKISGMLLEDVEVSSVSDLGSLTSQLEAALKETGKANTDELEMTEEEKQRIKEEADDGW
mmetsp:Transcript_18489/g.28196  ORF Transcript_18489/g.28196 Transcript_18489/m.28196 type:complete len:165 (+) Transcript_18489:143-637(+)